jgi:hypothetical protein
MHTLPDKLETEDDFNHYWENIAESNKLIGHKPDNLKAQRFFTDWDAVAGTKVKGPILVVSRLPIRYTDAGDNIHQIPQYEIAVMVAVGNEGEKAITAGLNLCKQITKQIFGKLIYDSAPTIEHPRYFTRFHIDEAQTTLLDDPAMNDGWVGAASSVPMGSPELIGFNENDWL